MRIVRLLVENWRGVERREIEFGPGVTIVEGPNEAGKSTMIEALDRLLHDLDSTTKQTVRAAQPLGKDVGSTVEAVLSSGEYRFVYRKTFNKDRQTSLHIEAPVPAQLTGRDAHRRATEILEQTVDMGLWRALLVEQGTEVAQARIKDSAGLARALDEAAGSAQPEGDDTALLGRIESEYELYFTPRAGKARFAESEDAVVALTRLVEAAQAAVDEVASDLREYEQLRRVQVECEQALPGYARRLDEAQRQWSAVEVLETEIRQLEEKHRLRAQHLDLAGLALERREADIAARASAARDSAALREGLGRLEAGHARASAESADAREVLSAARAAREAAENALASARNDERQIRDEQALQRLRTELGRLESLRIERRSQIAALDANRVDADALAAIRAADRALESARVRLEALATRVALAAEQDLRMHLDGDTLELGAGDTAEREVASRLELSLPGVFSLRIEPAHSAEDLQAQAREMEARLAALLAAAGVESLTAAAASQARRADAETTLVRLRERGAEILDGRDPEAMAAEMHRLSGELKDAHRERVGETPLPKGLSAMERILRDAELALQAADERAREAQAVYETAHEHLAKENAAKTETGQALRIAEGALHERDQRLATERAQAPDEDLRESLAGCESAIQALESRLAEKRAALAGFSPESLQLSLENAGAVLARAHRERDETVRRAGLLEDRLERAQADGRYETLERERARLAQAEETLQLTRRRAAAASRLFETVHRHRDAARRTYVAPLRERIDRLGRIVYGRDFSIELDDEWTLVSRSLGGITVPFEDLSVGAREQVGILARLAVAQLVAADGGVPLIIDDALGFSDPGRLRDMGTAIAAAGKACQVIVLTCFPGRYAQVGNASVVHF